MAFTRTAVHFSFHSETKNTHVYVFTAALYRDPLLIEQSVKKLNRLFRFSFVSCFVSIAIRCCYRYANRCTTTTVT